MKCPKCGGKLQRVQNWNPTTKKLENSYRYTHIYGLNEVLITKSLCTYVTNLSPSLPMEAPP